MLLNKLIKAGASAPLEYKMKAKLGKFSVLAQDGDDLYLVQHTNSIKSGYATLVTELTDVNGKKFEVGIMSTPDGHFKGF